MPSTRSEFLHGVALLDSEAEEAFDRITRLASSLLRTPVALVSLIDKDRQFFKSQVGLAEPWASLRETPLSHSFCQYVADDRALMVVEDSRLDPRLVGNGAIEDLNVIAYLGAPLCMPGGPTLGALCVIDSKPRRWTEIEIAQLTDLSRVVIDEILLRSKLHDLEALETRLRHQNELFHQALEYSGQGLCFFDADGTVIVANRRYAEIFQLKMRDVAPGTSLERLLQKRTAIGTASAHDSEYERWRRTPEARTAPKMFHKLLADDRTIRLLHQPTPNGGWVATVEDITSQVAAERALRVSEKRYKLLADNSSDVIILGQNNGFRTYFSPSVERLTGFTPTEALNITMPEWVHPADLKGLFDATSALSPEKPTVTAEHRLRRKDGSYIWVEGAFTLVSNEGPEPYIVANIRDVTKRRTLEAEYRNLFEHAVVGIYRRDLSGRLIRANPALVRMRGHASEEELLAADRQGRGRWRMDPVRRSERMAALMRDGVISDFVSEVTFKDTGVTLHVSETAWLVRGDDQAPLYIEGTIVDVTDTVNARRTLQVAALRDSMTGLDNRHAFREAADAEAPARAPDAPLQPRLLFVDLDRFKNVNDTLGHAAGDELLKEIAARLAATVGGAGTLARLGGDEFAVLLNRQASETEAEQLAVRLIAAINHAVTLPAGHVVNVGASIGIAAFRAGEADAEQIIRRADAAMYCAKRDGRNGYRVHSEGMEDQILEKQSLEAEFRRAVVQDQIEVHYQPIFELEGLKCCGHEALVRWRHPQRGLIAPGAFIPLAEETGLVVQMGEVVLASAIRQAAHWPDAQRVAVNASTIQLRHPDFLPCLVSNLELTGLDPSRVEIEVTETAFLEDSPQTLEVLRTLQRIGVKVALDDFGTGWSALSYLRTHPFDRIKIDRSFVHAFADNRNEAILRSIVELSKRLGAGLTAEGIETESQLKALRAFGCDEGQGYLLGRPVQHASVEELPLAAKPMDGRG